MSCPLPLSMLGFSEAWVCAGLGHTVTNAINLCVPPPPPAVSGKLSYNILKKIMIQHVLKRQVQMQHYSLLPVSLCPQAYRKSSDPKAEPEVQIWSPKQTPPFTLPSIHLFTHWRLLFLNLPELEWWLMKMTPVKSPNFKKWGRNNREIRLFCVLCS